MTKSAFSIARRKLHFGAFSEINRIVVDSFYANQPVRRWRGWRLLAIDGSTLQLPRNAEVGWWFGGIDVDQPASCPMGRISVAYDVLNRIIVDANLAPYRIGEQELAVSHLQWIEGRDLLLFDRGYPAFWLIALLHRQGIQFCMRINVNFNRAVGQFFNSTAAEAIIDLNPGAEARRHCRDRGIAIDPMRTRLVRVPLPTGETELLITSLLDTEQYSREIFSDLYAKRWGIEESYKALKCRVELGNFSGKSVHAVMQDFHARIATTNMTALMSDEAQRTIDSDEAQRAIDSDDEKPRSRVNFSYALSRMKDTIVRLILMPDPRQLLMKLLELLRRTREPVRPDRLAPRNKRVLPRRFLSTYRRCG